ncbi:MAG: GNAT family N-acetyltransferase [Alphaproteobacteria bacterium]|nr:GNAT family N-acetyltransferase [Alphaproteobacteria bacterium]
MTRPDLVVAGPAHAEALAALHGLCFPEGWAAEAFANLLGTPGSAAVIAVVEEPAGFLLWRLLGDEAEIITLGVVPHRRRSGIAGLLMADACDRAAAGGATSIVLEVAVDNQPACAFYTAQGFAEVGMRRGYYRRAGAPSVDAVILRRPLVARI